MRWPIAAVVVTLTGCRTAGGPGVRDVPEAAGGAATAPGSSEELPVLAIRRGTAVTIDGRADAGEWHDAGTTAVGATTIRYKHDGTQLLFAFSGLGSTGAFRYPEILVDTAGDGGLVWGPDDWWFHASFRDCWSRGAYNDYASCVDQAPAWSASNYTDQAAAPAVIEVAIPLATLGLNAGAGVGLAFDVTDTQRVWTMWPADAQLAVPATWARARVE